MNKRGEMGLGLVLCCIFCVAVGFAIFEQSQSHMQSRYQEVSDNLVEYIHLYGDLNYEVFVETRLICESMGYINDPIDPWTCCNETMTCKKISEWI